MEQSIIRIRLQQKPFGNDMFNVRLRGSLNLNEATNQLAGAGNSIFNLTITRLIRRDALELG